MHAARLVDGAEELVKMIEPIWKTHLKQAGIKPVSTQYSLTEKVPSKKQRQNKFNKRE